MKLATQSLLVCGFVASLLATPALASSTQRTGFNFGATVRALDTEEETSAASAQDHNTQVQNSSQGINAYVGYAFTYIDLGFMYTNETSSTTATATTPDGQTTSTTRTNTTDQGESLYIRYLFAKYFYFQGGLGIYQQNLKVTDQTTQNQSSTFSGTQDEHNFTGVGPGYYFGGGLELPITNGFYFTAAYQARTVQLRTNVSNTDLGQNKSTEQKHEVLFGVAFYGN